MAFANRMTDLVNKIERRLGTAPLNLPDFLKKEKWVDIVKEDTMVTFSRYFPNKFKYAVNTDEFKKDGWYYIDEELLDGIKILGLRDISWEDFARDSISLQQRQGYGVYDFMTTNYGMDDIMQLQMRADHTSLFNNGVYPIFEYPNKIALRSVTGADVTKSLKQFQVILLIQHNRLETISPTKMETFEALAQADIANFLYKNLKYYDQLETVYATIDLKLQDIESEAGKRDEVITSMKEGYVTAANDNQPFIITV